MLYEQLEKITNNWESIGLLQGYDGEAMSLATCLEAQRIKNESLSTDDPQFRRTSIPLIVRIFSASEAVKRNVFANYFDGRINYASHN